MLQLRQYLNMDKPRPLIYDVTVLDKPVEITIKFIEEKPRQREVNRFRRRFMSSTGKSSKDCDIVFGGIKEYTSSCIDKEWINNWYYITGVLLTLARSHSIEHWKTVTNDTLIQETISKFDR